MRLTLEVLAKKEGVSNIHIIDKPTVVFGRSKDADLVLPLRAVSPRHAEIRENEEGVKIRDLASRNGTALNGRLLEPDVAYDLSDGDIVAISGYEISLRLEKAQETSTLQLKNRLLATLREELKDQRNLPSLFVVAGMDAGERFFLDPGTRSVLGRSPQSDIQIKDSSLSREQAWLHAKKDRVIIEDRGGLNALLLNGQPLKGKTLLQDGDEILAGETLLRFSDPNSYNAYIDGFDKALLESDDPKSKKSSGAFGLPLWLEYVFVALAGVSAVGSVVLIIWLLFC